MKLLWPEPNRRVGFIDILGMTGLLGLLVARFVPIATLPFWGCVLRRNTGWPCLGCGLTRVADRVSLGNISGAWDANPLGTVFALLFAGAAAMTVLHLGFKVPVPDVELSARQQRALRVGLAVAVVLNWAFLAAKAKAPALFG